MHVKDVNLKAYFREQLNLRENISIVMLILFKQINCKNLKETLEEKLKFYNAENIVSIT